MLKASFAVVALTLVLAGCGAKGPRAPLTENGTGGSAAAAGDTAAGGTAGSIGSGGNTSAGGAPGATALPLPPGGSVPKPAGAPDSLTVLDWAGFEAAVSYSFDDSQPSQIEHYADLEATGVPLTFYINSGGSSAPNYAVTWQQAVKDGHEIGNHTVHHCRADLTGCTAPLATPAAEIEQCSTYATQILGQSAVWTMASPFGDTGWDPFAEQYFFLNRGVGSGMIAPNDTTDPFNLPTHAAVTSESTDSFNSAIDAAQTGRKWLIFLVHTIFPSSANWYAPIDISTVTGSIEHAKSLSNIWLGTVADIGAYWRAQKLLSSAAPAISGSDKTWTWTLPAHFPPGKYLRIKVDGGTLKQGGTALDWNDRGFYEIALDAGSLTLSP